MKRKVEIFFVRAILLISVFLILFKLLIDTHWSWCKITSPLWIGLPLVGLISGIIDVWKFYNEK